MRSLLLFINTSLNGIHNLLRRAKELRGFLPLASTRRAVVLTFSYCATAVVFVTVLILLKEILPPDALQGVLGYIFISGLAAGIEPGTAKAQLLRANSHVGMFRFAFPWLLIGSAGKAILLSPLLIAAWLLTDHGVLGTDSIVMWSPAVVTLGFMTTELRTAFDVNGRYASAIWLKQGSLSIGLLSLATVMGNGLPLQAAIATSLFMRLAWLVVFLVRGRQYLERTPINRVTILSEGMDHRWIELSLTSAFAAVGGSLDRIIAFRYLNATEANGYYIIYELLSKFWLFPYIFGPVVFAKRARYQDHSRFVGVAVFSIVGLGIVFVAAVSLMNTFWPQLIGYISNGVEPSSGVIFFAGAIVLTSLSMVLNADLQGMGQTRAVATISFLSVIVSAISFYAFISYAALYGIYLAWLIKSALELTMILAFILHLRQK